jgi:FtsX extracellular domain
VSRPASQLPGSHRLFVIVSLVAAVLTTVCTPDGTTKRGGIEDVAVGTWVNELCTELDRFAQSSLSPATDFWSDVDAFDEMTARFEELAGRVADLGTPSVPRGDEIAAEIVARLRDSASTLKELRTYVVGRADGEETGEPDASLERVSRAAMYPYALLGVLWSASLGADDVVVYLSDPVARATVSRLTERLLDVPNVTDVHFETKAEACERFKEIFENQPALVESVDCDELPASLRVEVPDRVSGLAVQAALEGETGVDQVVVPNPPVDPLTGSGISDAEIERLAPIADAAAYQPACQPEAKARE